MSPFWQNTVGGAVGAVLAAAGIGGYGWFAGLMTSLGGVHACAESKQIYIPGHSTADKHGCVALRQNLTLVESDEVEVSTGTFHKKFAPTARAVLIVSANMTSERDSDHAFSFVWTSIEVDNKPCSSDENYVTDLVAGGFLIHSSAACVITLMAGDHSLLAAGTARGVKSEKNILLVRYTLLSE